MNIPRANFLGCPMDLVTKSDFLNLVDVHIREKSDTKIIQFVNANKVAKVDEDSSMRELMWKADFVLTDGQPLLPIARSLGIPVPERIDGIGLMRSLLELADQQAFRIFLLGAKQGIVEKCVEIIEQDFPKITIAGYRNGYFNEKQGIEIAEQIAATKPDLLFLGMGSPMKENFAERHRHSVGSKIIQGVGGSFDVPRAPVWMQKIGLEWLFRVMQEPRRMFWRYMTTNARFLCLYIKAFIRKYTSKPETKINTPESTY